jgi:hypothetical protein
VAGVRVSVSAKFWNWPGAPPQDRFIGEVQRWGNKEQGKIRIRWQQCPQDQETSGQEFATESSTEDLFFQNEDTTYLFQPQLGFVLEPYSDGRPAPSVAPTPVATPFLLSKGDLSDPAVLRAHVDRIVAPAKFYFTDRLLKQRSPQMDRMKAARLFDPLYVQAHGVSSQDVDALQCFKFSKHPAIAPQIVKMKSQLQSYIAKVAEIKPLGEREAIHESGPKKGEHYDTFNIQNWWRSQKIELDAFYTVLRAVLTHSPNSCPPERVFSILNNSFDDDQLRALADYIELSLQLQFNTRGR